MELHLSLDGHRALGAGVYTQLREAILAGRLRPGERLPATRALAQRLAVSRNTVTYAYERLVAEGFAEARVGAGTFVSARETRAPAPRLPGALTPRAFYRDPPPAEEASTPYDFGIGVPDPSLFPWDV